MCAATVAIAQQMTVDINKVSESGVGEKIGTVTVTGGKQGVSFKVAVTGVGPGQHGFHVHEKGDCNAAAKDGKMDAAGAAGPTTTPKARNPTRGQKASATKAICPSSNPTPRASIRPSLRRA